MTQRRASRAGASVEAHRLSDVAVLSTFASLDTDHSKTISAEELRVALEKLHVPLSEADFKQVLERLDGDKDGKITEQDFLQFYRKREDELFEAYLTVCEYTEQRSRLTAASLRQGLEAMGLKVSDEEIRSFVRKLDLNADGDVGFDEFRDVLLLVNGINTRGLFDYVRRGMMVEHASSEYTPPVDAGPSLSAACISLLSGSVAGVVSRTGTAPIDRLKTIMQAGVEGAPRGVISGLKGIYADGGVKAFFRGNGVNCLKVGPEMGIKMVAFDRLKGILSEARGALTPMERFIAGGIAGALAQAIVYPLEIVKTRLSLSHAGDPAQGLIACTRSIVSNEGARALYRGCGLSIVGVVPYAGIDLAVNSTLREVAAEYYDQRGEEPSMAIPLACGMLASTTAMVSTYPIGLIRTRIQASGLPGSPVYSGPMDALAKTLRAEGWRGLFRGIVPNLLKVVPAGALSAASYSAVSDRLKMRERALARSLTTSDRITV